MRNFVLAISRRVLHRRAQSGAAWLCLLRRRGAWLVRADRRDRTRKESRDRFGVIDHDATRYGCARLRIWSHWPAGVAGVLPQTHWRNRDPRFRPGLLPRPP